MLLLNILKLRENGNNDNLQWTIFTFLIATRHKDNQIPNIIKGKKTDIDNQYDIYSITCADVSSMIQGVDFTVSYAPVAWIQSLFIITAIVSAEGAIIFVLDISDAFQNTILPNLAERVYLS